MVSFGNMYSIYFAIISSLLLCVSATAIPERRASSSICSDIQAKIRGDVYYALTLSDNFAKANQHWMSSSSQTPLCVVEVADAQDVSAVMKLVGSTRTPFAVKSGGHASNLGFSSTTGVQISLSKINQVYLSPDRKTVEIGLGNVWTDVFSALDGTGVNVVGGRVSGPGTGGFSLGGGFSWKSNQYGLTSDTIVSYTLVLPNGTITTVTAANKDLFFALKGGLNRFGIVTSAIYKTHLQPAQVYGGVQLFTGDQIPALIIATQKFQDTNTDPKAQVITTLNGGPTSNALVLFFYDGPARPSSFDAFDKIPALLSTLKTQTYASFAKSSPSEIQAGSRGAFATFSTTGLTKNFQTAIYNETLKFNLLSLLGSLTLASYDIEPFMKYGSHAVESAFPHADSPLPLNLYFAWKSAADDAYWRDQMQQSIDRLKNVARAERIYDENSVAYPNYALDTTNAKMLYGAKNAARLRAIRDRIDPDKVMALTGGFYL